MVQITLDKEEMKEALIAYVIDKYNIFKPQAKIETNFIDYTEPTGFVVTFIDSIQKKKEGL